MKRAINSSKGARRRIQEFEAFESGKIGVKARGRAQLGEKLILGFHSGALIIPNTVRGERFILVGPYKPPDIGRGSPVRELGT